MGTLALPAVLGESYVYIYVPTKWKNDVNLVGGKMADGQMYQPSLCDADSKVQQRSEEDCKEQPHYTSHDQIMFHKSNDIRLINISMPEINLSVRLNT
jgi:hypothetical protein